MNFYEVPEVRVTVVFQSYTDESGMHTNESSPYVSMAGYFGHENAWKGFIKDWTLLLEQFGLDDFHMTKFLARKEKPFIGWSDDTYDKCIYEFIEVIQKYNLQGFAVQVSRDDYESIYSKGVKKAFTKDPYILVFDHAITFLLKMMYWLPDNEKVTAFFDRTRFKAKAEQVYERRRRRDPHGDRLAIAPLFVSAKEYPPLQAADILANISRRYARGKIVPGLMSERLEGYLRLLISANRTAFRLLTADDLKRSQAYLQARIKKPDV